MEELKEKPNAYTYLTFWGRKQLLRFILTLIAHRIAKGEKW